MRGEVRELVALGAFPPGGVADLQTLERQDALIRGLRQPATDDEARALCVLFGPDEYYGLTWPLLHFIESAPSWPIEECLTATANEWAERMRARVRNARDGQD